MPEDPLAYFITIRAYGTWLHGDERGSVDPGHNAYGSPPIAPDWQLENIRASRLKTPPITFIASQRKAIKDGIEATCSHRGWGLVAINVRTNHVHAVVASTEAPERVMNVLKSYATREMVARGVLPRGVKAWSRHGSTKYLWTEADVAAAWEYVVEGQGPTLD
jgi:REP element-mobilizing transposase RayT